MPPKKPKRKKIEPDPDAWERFEHAVDAAVKSGPKHRQAKERQPDPKGRRKGAMETGVPQKNEEKHR